MKFRPCVDLHAGRVKQIVGSTLSDDPAVAPTTNFETDLPPAHFAKLFRDDGLFGGHVIMLGPGNEEAAAEALAAFPGGFHVGGGINPDNAKRWLDAGASHVVVTSFVFRGGVIDFANLDAMEKAIGRDRLVLDLSCKKRDGLYYVVTDRWQKWTDVPLSRELFAMLGARCDEFLVHAADIEGQRCGIDADLVALLAESCELPVTYAGGVGGLADVRAAHVHGSGRIDVTVGSALDIYGGALSYRELVAFVKGLDDTRADV